MEFAFASFQDFLQMGKYGLYVWLCYGLTALIVIVNVIIYQFKRKTLIKTIQDDQARKLKQQQNTLNR